MYLLHRILEMYFIVLFFGNCTGGIPVVEQEPGISLIYYAEPSVLSLCFIFE